MAYADYTFYTADFHGNKISERIILILRSVHRNISTV